MSSFSGLYSYRPYGKNTPKTEIIERVANNLESALARKDPLDSSQMLTSGPGARQPQMPEYSRKIKPWAGASGSDSPFGMYYTMFDCNGPMLYSL